jgi:hypothetical protein
MGMAIFDRGRKAANYTDVPVLQIFRIAARITETTAPRLA